MAGQIIRKVGQPLYLEAHLSDQETSKRVIAQLLNADGSLRSSIELTHVSNGLFIEDTEPMPNIDTLLVRYYTYELDGVTLDEDYVITEERYMLYAAITIGDSVEGSIVVDEELSGTVAEASIEGVILDDGVIEGIINDTDLLEGIAYEY